MLASALQAVLLPALVAGVVLALGWARGAAGERGAVAGLAVAAGYPLGYTLIIGWPPFPAIEATQWSVYLALAAGALTALPERLAPIGRGLVAIVTPTLLLWPLVTRRFGALETVAWLGGWAALLFAVFTLLGLVGRRPAGRLVPLCFTVTAGVGSGALLLSGSALVGQLGGVLAAVAGALAVGGLVWRQRSAAGAALPLMTVWGTLLIVGVHYVEMLPAAALLLALAPLAPWAVAAGPFGRLTGFRALLVAGGLALVAAAGALLAVQASIPDDPYPY